MKKFISFLAVLFTFGFINSPVFGVDDNDPQNEKSEGEFKYQIDQFADIRLLRYKIPNFEQLTQQQKELLFYLYEAGLSGRDMIWDQNYKHNLTIRRTLETILENYEGDRTATDWEKFMEYTKRVWFSNGIHHHYSTKKILPEFSTAYFSQLVKSSSMTGKFPLEEGEMVNDLIKKLTPILFDQFIDEKKVNLDPNKDIVTNSANNFYENINQKEAEAFYATLIDNSNPTQVSHGLNSKLVKENGVVTEKVWKIGGMYSDAIEKVVYWLNKAQSVAENDLQKQYIGKLIEYYQTGDLNKFDEYNIMWVKDTSSTIDFINGFIEVYGDAMGYKGSFESVVYVKDMDASKRIDAIRKEAQWFEDHSPIMSNHKKKKVIGISAKVITVVGEAGDASPSTPIGINLPNSNWIRSNHGSKSVNLGNITQAYSQASTGGGVLSEFTFSKDEVALAKKYGQLADDLHTDMHEVIGHASGKINEGVGTPNETLKSYASTLEEARADLVALYYLLDQKLVDIGVMPSLEVGKAGYNDYILNGLIFQIVRIPLGESIEESHMRNRQMICKWVFEKGKTKQVIEWVTKEGKTHVVINDYAELQKLFGELLAEIQRIKSEGDYEAGKALVENYGVKIDKDLHEEVLQRYNKLAIPPYAGFVNPQLVPVFEGNQLIDVKVVYPESFTDQMIYYSKNYSFLPNYN